MFAYTENLIRLFFFGGSQRLCTDVNMQLKTSKKAEQGKPTLVLLLYTDTSAVCWQESGNMMPAFFSTHRGEATQVTST